jgi:hypothetical protein
MASAAAHDHGDGTFVVFASLQAITRSGVDAHSDSTEDAWGIADAVFSRSLARLRLFGELNATSREFDLERLQIGIEPFADTVIWFGRFHQPASAWNSEHHHGRYLQTSITRPSIEFWEDEEGAIPQHLLGTLIESRRPLGRSAGLQVIVGAGAGSVLEDRMLESVELLHSSPGGQRLSVTARVAYLPAYLGASSAGLLLGRHDIVVRDAATAASLGAGRIRQDVIGAFIDWDAESWRLKAAAYRVQTAPQAVGAAARFFAAGYLQAERRLPHALTLYARHENSTSATRSSYVALFGDDFTLHGNCAGLRWDAWRRAALTLEAGRRSVAGGTKSEARLQWSAALP